MGVAEHPPGVGDAYLFNEDLVVNDTFERGSGGDIGVEGRHRG